MTRRWTLLVVLACSLVVPTAALAQQAAPPGPQKPCSKDDDPKCMAPINDVVAEIGKALANLSAWEQKHAGKQLPPFKSATVNLQTVVTRELTGGLNLWVITLGTTWTKERSQVVEFVLVPPKPAATLAEPSLSAELSGAVIRAAEGLENATGSLSLKSLSVQLAFKVSKKDGGGISLIPVGPALAGSGAEGGVQTVTLLFAVPDAAK